MRSYNMVQNVSLLAAAANPILAAQLMDQCRLTWRHFRFLYYQRDAAEKD